jgi:predicted NBD/HSP70 family sugar kinase/transposase-like protein
VCYNPDVTLTSSLITRRSSTRIKDLEKARIFGEILSSNTTSRTRLARELELRPTTVSNVIKELIDDGLVGESTRPSEGRRGRPHLLLRPHLNRLSAISIYVVSTAIRGALVNLGDELVSERKRPLPVGAENDQIMEAIDEVISELAREVPANSELVGVGLSLPGRLNSQRSEWSQTSRWNRLQDLSFENIERELGVPVQLFNSMDAQLEYLLSAQAYLRRSGVILVHWGFGVGASYSMAGEVLGDRTGHFAEIGHWRVNLGNERLCACGSVGCVETVSALWALLPELRNRFPGTPEDENDFAAFLLDNPIEEDAVMDEAIDTMAVVLRNLYRILFPEFIMVHGPFTNKRTLFTKLSRRFYQELGKDQTRRVTLKALKMDNRREILGSCYPFFRSALDQYLIARWGSTPRAE